MGEIARRFFGRYRTYFIAGPAVKTIEVVFDLLTPLVVARMIDAGVRGTDGGAVTRGGVLLVVFAVCGVLATLVCQKLAALASQGVATDIRHELYATVNAFSFADLDRFSPTSLVTRITNDVNQVQLAVSMLIRQVVRWPVLAVGSLLCAIALDPGLSLVFWFCLPLVAAVFYGVMAHNVPLFSQMQARLDDVGRIASEALGGVRVVRAFDRDDHERCRFARAVKAQTSVAERAGALSALLNPATFLILNGGICAILWLGGQQVGSGRLEQGQVMALIGYMNQLLVSIAYIANLVVIFTRAHASALRIDEVLDHGPSMAFVEHGASPVPGVPALVLDDVTFGYGGSERPALSHVSLTLRPGEVLGVIGGTGSGKSTLAQLAVRLYDPSEGAVGLFGHDAKDYDEAALRGLVSYVPQSASLVSGTIRENLCWRDGAADDEELWAALEAAQAAEFVRGRDGLGLEAPVEPFGRNFSGGQRQRLSVARALVGAPALLVLDDAASALDFRTEALLRASLASLPSDPARIVVSQRVASVRHADRICVLDGGAVAGLGTHDELMETCDVYREICLSQLTEEEAS